MKAIITISAICILLTVGCNRNPENPDKLRTIFFERCIETEQKMKISEIADTIEYLELKTPHDIVISRILNIVCGDNFWLIHTRQGIYKFTRTGEFVKQIGRTRTRRISLYSRHRYKSYSKRDHPCGYATDLIL